MTITEFRQNPLLVLRMREVLSDEIVQRAILVVRDHNLPQELPLTADAVASVRLHSRGVGYNAAVADLLSLADLVPPPEEEPEPDYAGA